MPNEKTKAEIAMEACKLIVETTPIFDSMIGHEKYYEALRLAREALKQPHHFRVALAARKLSGSILTGEQVAEIIEECLNYTETIAFLEDLFGQSTGVPQPMRVRLAALLDFVRK